MHVGQEAALQHLLNLCSYEERMYTIMNQDVFLVLEETGISGHLPHCRHQIDIPDLDVSDAEDSAPDLMVLQDPEQTKTTMSLSKQAKGTRSTPAPRVTATPTCIENGTRHLPQPLREKYKVASTGIAQRYAMYIFKHNVSYEVYCGWTHNVNYERNQIKKALPENLWRAIVEEVQWYFKITDHLMRTVKDSNGILRHTKARPWKDRLVGIDFAD
ncbi:uncharacterized protein LOC142467246 [Ascaphus truei]|uniref:uncharacterized protein LOC142467246 n=1 Tax=Ascaphus truei TaxID=8439 RepID=UPI003F5A3064